jgi:hypothetical protein
MLVVRGAPVDEHSLREECDIMARRFVHGAEPLWGFSVEGLTREWPLERILRGGRVRSRRAYAICQAAELRQLGCEILATFGDEPPHYTVQVLTERALRGVAQLLSERINPNPNWTK